MKGVFFTIFTDALADSIVLLFADDAARFGGTTIRYQQQMNLVVRNCESFGMFLSKNNLANLIKKVKHAFLYVYFLCIKFVSALERLAYKWI